MEFLYCNVGWMRSYNGNTDERPVGGGSYNKDNIGHEVNNFTNHDGTYYGYVQSSGQTIDISKHYSVSKASEYVDGITVIWLSRHVVVGYYLDARVYRKLQYISGDIAEQRVYPDYKISATTARLIPEQERSFEIKGYGQSNVWYGNEEMDRAVEQYIEDFEKQITMDVNSVSDFSKPLEGLEKEAVIKARVNQSVFRKKMLEKYHSRCCLCGVHTPDLLRASHIKPWSCSDSNEKLAEYNGLLLCPNHDRLFDGGYISFDDDGRILISEKLDETDRVFMNIRDNMRIPVDGDMKPFLRYHRSKVFMHDDETDA